MLRNTVLKILKENSIYLWSFCCNLVILLDICLKLSFFRSLNGFSQTFIYPFQMAIHGDPISVFLFAMKSVSLICLGTNIEFYFLIVGDASKVTLTPFKMWASLNEFFCCPNGRKKKEKKRNWLNTWFKITSLIQGQMFLILSDQIVCFPPDRPRL